MFFDELAKRDIEAYVLVGNHDTYFKNTNEVNSGNLLIGDYGNITIINSPQTIHLEYGNPRYDVCMMPWICVDNYEQSMLELKHTSATLCMGHFEIAGFAMYRGMPSEEGLNRGLFDKFEYTFSGHYHHKSDMDSIYYLGNPYELTWQDYNDPRGFHLFDMATRDLTFIRNPNVMFHKMIYDDKTFSIKDILATPFTEYTGKYVKVVVVNKTNPYLFDQYMNKLYDVNPVDITIVEDALDLTEDTEDDKIDEAEDTITIINKYVDGLENDGIDNTKLKTMMRELYVEALNLEQA
jgi:DNA repair exonuclease SbcCD nuclease subunit